MNDEAEQVLRDAVRWYDKNAWMQSDLDMSGDAALLLLLEDRDALRAKVDQLEQVADVARKWCAEHEPTPGDQWYFDLVASLDEETP